MESYYRDVYVVMNIWPMLCPGQIDLQLIWTNCWCLGGVVAAVEAAAACASQRAGNSTMRGPREHTELQTYYYLCYVSRLYFHGQHSR